MCGKLNRSRLVKEGRGRMEALKEKRAIVLKKTRGYRWLPARHKLKHITNINRHLLCIYVEGKLASWAFANLRKDLKKYFYRFILRFTRKMWIIFAVPYKCALKEKCYNIKVYFMVKNEWLFYGIYEELSMWLCYPSSSHIISVVLNILWRTIMAVNPPKIHLYWSRTNWV